MNKKFIVFIVMLTVATSCKKNETPAIQVDNGLNIKTCVAAETGLILRSAPDSSSEALANVPFKEEVIIVKYSDKDGKLDKITAPWAFVRYKNLEGWLFSGHLGGVKKGNYMNLDLEQLRNEVSRKYKATVDYPESGKKVINTPDQIKILERNIYGDVCVAWYCVGMECGFDEPSEEYAPSVWYYRNGKWNYFDIVGSLGGSVCTEVLDIRLLNINNDDLIDILVFAEINSGSIATFYLNDGNTFNEVYDTSDYPMSEASIVSEGTCSAVIEYSYLADKDKDGTGSTSQKSVRFNCRTNKFE